MKEEIDDKKLKRINKIAEKYKSHEKFIIARSARKTIRFIEKNTENFPNEYRVLKERIIHSCYDILKNIYRANINQDIHDKKEIVVEIEMLNFYLEEALNKGILTAKKFTSYAKHLIELDRMTRAWLKYEKNE